MLKKFIIHFHQSTEFTVVAAVMCLCCPMTSSLNTQPVYTHALSAITLRW